MAAALMVAEGRDVVAVTLKLWQGRRGGAGGRLLHLEDAEDARRVAARLDIPYYVLDHTGPFKSGVSTSSSPGTWKTTPTRASSAAARSSSPRCWRRGAGCVATCWRPGTTPGSTGRRADGGCGAGSTETRTSPTSSPCSARSSWSGSGSRSGLTKTETREEAARLGLRTAAKPESQDICFVGPEGYRGFVRRRAPQVSRPGSIVDRDGRVIGDHDGVAGFTVGQRRGIGLPARTPATSPRWTPPPPPSRGTTRGICWPGV